MQHDLGKPVSGDLVSEVLVTEEVVTIPPLRGTPYNYDVLRQLQLHQICGALAVPSHLISSVPINSNYASAYFGSIYDV